MDLRPAALLRIAQAADERDDVQTELALGQDQRALLLWTIGLVVLGTGVVLAGPDDLGEGHRSFQGSHGAMAVVGDPEGTVTDPAALAARFEATVRGGVRTTGSSDHGEALLREEDSLPYQLELSSSS
jgi:hypothetical protein